MENEQASENLTIIDFPGDADGAGQSDRAEFITDTDPLASSDSFRIANFSQTGNGGFVSLEFTSKTTRFYQVHDSGILSGGSWQKVGPGTVSGEACFTSVGFNDPAAANKFYRVSAMRPLAGF